MPKKRLAALRSIRKSKNFEPLAVSFKRIRKILEKSNVKSDGLSAQPELFESEAERETVYRRGAPAAAKVQTEKARRTIRAGARADRWSAQKLSTVFPFDEVHGDGGERGGAQKIAWRCWRNYCANLPPWRISQKLVQASDLKY